MNRQIIRLSQETINQIAAGEVIENPASVVKELVENAIDAGSSEIIVETRGGGFEWILVSDNGSGMSPEDATACFERHATSKIQKVEDLDRLFTMGFRGEALAALSAISKTTLLTSQEGLFATKVEVEGGHIVKVSKGARKKGTTVEVRFLFYNVPARKKFQKSASSSTGEIRKVMMHLILAHPECGFELIQEGQTIFQVPQAKGLLSRIQEMLEETCAQEHLIPLNLEIGSCFVEGALVSPLVHRPNRLGQFLFVNRRPVSCFPLSQTIREAFGTRLSSDRHPLFTLHLTIPSDEVDVNVHPQKKEIRLAHEKKLKEALYQGVLLALQKGNLIAEEKPFSVSENAFEWSYPIVTEMEFETPLVLQESAPAQKEIPFAFPVPSCSILGLIACYLVVDGTSLPEGLSSDGLVLFDLKSVFEKITYEKLMTQQKRGGGGQGLLIPITIPLSIQESASIHEHLEQFKSLGFEMRMIGKTTLLVEAVPQEISLDVVDSYVRYFIEKEMGENLEIFVEETAVFVRQNKTQFTLEEGAFLLKELLAMPSPQSALKGKKTFISIGVHEIQKRF